MSESNETKLPLVITSAPGRIWLDLGFDPGEQGNVHFSNLNELTWSANNATGDGIEYVRSDLARSAAPESAQDQFHADTGYDWNDPAGDDVRKVWTAGRASALPSTETSEDQALSVDALAQEIRRVDGAHSLGAGALAEALMQFLARWGAPQPGVATAAWMHNDDPTRVISASQKAQAVKDGGASASSLQPYSIALFAAPQPEFPSGVLLVREADGAPMQHPTYGPGVFYTEDCLFSSVEDIAPQLVERKAQPVSDNGAVNDAYLSHREILASNRGYRAGLADGKALGAPSQAHGKSEAVTHPNPDGLDALADMIATLRDPSNLVLMANEILHLRKHYRPADGAVSIPACPANAHRGGWILDRLPHTDMLAVREYLANSTTANFAAHSNPSQSTGDSVRVEGGEAAFLSDADMADLQRFTDLVDDGEDYDIPKERMKRLAELGVVKSHGFGRYSITSFGRMCLGSTLLRWPLETIDECNERLGREHTAKLVQQAAPAAEGGR